MEIVTPEEFLGVTSPVICWHFGTCDICSKRLILVLHFNYDKQPLRDFKICLRCLKENAETIHYGWMNFKVDSTLDLMYAKD